LPARCRYFPVTTAAKDTAPNPASQGTLKGRWKQSACWNSSWCFEPLRPRRVRLGTANGGKSAYRASRPLLRASRYCASLEQRSDSDADLFRQCVQGGFVVNLPPFTVYNTPPGSACLPLRGHRFPVKLTGAGAKPRIFVHDAASRRTSAIAKRSAVMSFVDSCFSEPHVSEPRGSAGG